jgi:hypothetical protein
MPRPPATSQILNDLVAQHQGDRITIGEFLHSLSNRGFGIAILIFALPNTPPLGIPGISSICALPIFFFAAQMLLGRKEMWIPSWVARQSFSPRTFAKAIAITTPWLRKLEVLIKPRGRRFTTPLMERLTGLIIMVLAAVIFLPIPGGNFLPAICMCLLALGFLERDGVLLMLGHVLSIGVLWVMYKVILAALSFAYNWLLG